MAAERSFQSRWSLRFWAIAIVLFFGSFVVGIIAANASPGGDTVAAWGPIIFPLYSSLICTPLLVIALVLSVRTLRAEGAGARSIITLILCILSLIPAAALLSVVALSIAQ